MWRLRQYPPVLVRACGLIVFASLIAHETAMGLEFHLKLFRQVQSECPLKAVLVHSGEDQYRIPVEAFDTGTKEAHLDIEAFPFERKPVYVEVEFYGCAAIQSKELVAKRGAAFYARIGDRTVEFTLRAAGAWI